MDIDLPDLTNAPRPDLRQPRTYSGLPFGNPIDAAIPSEPVDVTEQDVQEAVDEGDEEVQEVEAPEEEGLTEAAAAPDFEEQEAEDEAQTQSKKKRKKKRKGVRI